MKSYLKELFKSFGLFASKASFVFIVLLLVVFAAIWYNHRTNKEPTSYNLYEVEGIAKRDVTQDKATIEVGTYVEGANVATIQEEANTKINSAIEKIKALGISEEKIKTSKYNISPKYNWTTNKTEGYEINVSIQVTIENTSAQDDKVGKVISAASEAGLNDVDSLYFEVSNRDSIVEELKVEAINDGKSKKDKLADASGIKLGKLVNVNFNNDSTGNYRYSYDSAKLDVETSSTPTSVEVLPGETEIEVRVILSYEIK